jgi:hypothetical protein
MDWWGSPWPLPTTARIELPTGRSRCHGDCRWLSVRGRLRRNLWRSSGALYMPLQAMPEQSASAFGMSHQVKRAEFRITRGEARSWSRGTDSGNRLKCFFCPRCGSRIWHESDPPVDTVTVKAGSLDQSVDASDAIHIWTSRALTGIVIPAAAMKFPEEPL